MTLAKMAYLWHAGRLVLEPSIYLTTTVVMQSSTTLLYTIVASPSDVIKLRSAIINYKPFKCKLKELC